MTYTNRTKVRYNDQKAGEALTAVTTSKRRTRNRNNGIMEDVYLPFCVKNVEDLGESKTGGYNTRFELEQLFTKVVIKTVVFGTVTGESVEDKIVDCILPVEVDSYELEELIGGCFEALLVFNQSEDKTFINIKDVRPLQPETKKQLQHMKRQEQREQQQRSKQISTFEDELVEASPRISKRKSSTTPSKNFISYDSSDDFNLEEDNLNSFDEEPTNDETELEDEEIELEVEDDFDYDFDFDDDLELELDEEEQTSDEDEEDTDDDCFYCNGKGCEECEDDTY